MLSQYLKNKLESYCKNKIFITLSRNIANELEELECHSIKIAEKPNQESMIKLILDNYFWKLEMTKSKTSPKDGDYIDLDKSDFKKKKKKKKLFKKFILFYFIHIFLLCWFYYIYSF